MRYRIFFFSEYVCFYVQCHTCAWSFTNKFMLILFGMLKLPENTKGRQKEKEPEKEDSLTKGPLGR